MRQFHYIIWFQTVCSFEHKFLVIKKTIEFEYPQVLVKDVGANTTEKSRRNHTIFQFAGNLFQSNPLQEICFAVLKMRLIFDEA